MSRAILCLVFVAILASIGHGKVIEKRSPGVADFADQIDEAVDLRGDFGSDAIERGKREIKLISTPLNWMCDLIFNRIYLCCNEHCSNDSYFADKWGGTVCPYGEYPCRTFSGEPRNWG